VVSGFSRTFSETQRSALVNEDKSTRYQRLKRQASILSLAAGIIVLTGLVWTGGHVALRDAAERLAPPSLPWRVGAIVFLYVVFLSLVNEIVTLPIAFYSGFVLERRYNLSTETLGGWVRDQLKSLVVGVALGGAAAEVVYWCIRRSPDQWWAPAGVLFTLAIVGLTNLAPVLLLPLFFTVKPLDREALRTRLLALAQRAGARVVGGVLGAGRLGDRERGRPPHQEAERHLAGGGVVCSSNVPQHAASGREPARKTPVPERAIADHGDVVHLTPGEHGVLDGARLQMVEDLIADQTTISSNVPDLFKVRHIEVTDAPGEDLTLMLQLLEGRDRLLQRVLAAPVQQVSIQPVGFQARERLLTGHLGPAL